MNELFDTIIEPGPLAARMRPRNLDEFIGQAHILGSGRLLRRAIMADQFTSLIFTGPPGCGKTTLAHVIACTTQSEFFSLNAVLSGLADLRQVVDRAQELKKLYHQKSILFVDEVHRWNKSQQDALLPWTENGTIILIGATTENPYFKVNRALVSRSHIFQLTALTNEDLMKAAQQTLADKERGYGQYDIEISDEALAHLVQFANGDCRSLLNALELAVETTPSKFPPDKGEKIIIDLSIAEESIQRKAVPYDPDGDDHYDTISAFIKSVRGSDPDAALYWLAQMLYRGEDPDYIWRRLLILASEDIGLADRYALTVVNNCIASFERIGLPEGYYPLAHATLYLATCEKTNSVMGFFEALKEVKAASRADVPDHLRDANRDAEGFAHGREYKYPHSYDDHWVAQQYLPLTLKGKIFYQPSKEGHEKEIRERVLYRREIQQTEGADFIPENQVAFSTKEKREGESRQSLPIKHVDASLTWQPYSSLYKTRGLTKLRDKLFKALALPEHSCVCIYGDNTGYLIHEAVRRFHAGTVYVLATRKQDATAIKFLTHELEPLHQPQIHLGKEYEKIPNSPDYYEGVILYRPAENPKILFTHVQQQLGPDSLLAVVLPAQIVSLACVFHQLLNDEQRNLLKKAEGQLNQTLWDEAWRVVLEEHDFGIERLDISIEEETDITREQIRHWFSARAPLGKILRSLTGGDKIQEIESKLIQDYRSVNWPRHYCIFICRRRKK